MSYVKGHYKTVNGKKVYVNGYYNSNSKHSNDSGEEVRIGGLEPMVKKNHPQSTILATPNREHDSLKSIMVKSQEFEQDMVELGFDRTNSNAGLWEGEFEPSSSYIIPNTSLEDLKPKLQTICDKYNQAGILAIKPTTKDTKSKYYRIGDGKMSLNKSIEALKELRVKGGTWSDGYLEICNLENDGFDDELSDKVERRYAGEYTESNIDYIMVENSNDEETVNEIDNQDYQKSVDLGYIQPNAPPDSDYAKGSSSKIEKIMDFISWQNGKKIINDLLERIRRNGK